ncbi:MAG: hypothetical protein V2A62_01240 [Candidatus Woesearchaeota archaeon]
MLEEKIADWKHKLLVGVGSLGLIFTVYNCGPSIIIPTRMGNNPTGINCCQRLNCSRWDGCKSEDEVYNPNTGNFEQSCHCYDIPSPSTEPFPARNGDKGDFPRYDRDSNSWK